MFPQLGPFLGSQKFSVSQGDGFILDKILDATGNKGTGKMTVMELAQQSVAGPTISAGGWIVGLMGWDGHTQCVARAQLEALCTHMSRPQLLMPVFWLSTKMSVLPLRRS